MCVFNYTHVHESNNKNLNHERTTNLIAGCTGTTERYEEQDATFGCSIKRSEVGRH